MKNITQQELKEYGGKLSMGEKIFYTYVASLSAKQKAWLQPRLDDTPEVEEMTLNEFITLINKISNGEIVPKNNGIFDFFRALGLVCKMMWTGALLQALKTIWVWRVDTNSLVEALFVGILVKD
jgi:hypothetical protein